MGLCLHGRSIRGYVQQPCACRSPASVKGYCNLDAQLGSIFRECGFQADEEVNC